MGLGWAAGGERGAPTLFLPLELAANQGLKFSAAVLGEMLVKPPGRAGSGGCSHIKHNTAT